MIRIVVVVRIFAIGVGVGAKVDLLGFLLKDRDSSSILILIFITFSAIFTVISIVASPMLHLISIVAIYFGKPESAS